MLIRSYPYYYRRRYLKHLCPIKKKHDILWSNIVNPPLPIKSEDIPTEYILRHRDSDYQFSQEFEMLPKGKNLDHTISERKENQKKNRYNDIKACDATRVRLHKLHGEVNSSDYINANFIKGYKSRKIFIATQGPLDSTIIDFWRMVWEQRFNNYLLGFFYTTNNFLFLSLSNRLCILGAKL